PASSRTPSLGDAFRDGLREAGWVDGQKLVIVYRTYADHPEGAPDLAAELVAELVALKPEVVTAAAAEAVLAFMRAPASMPIVMLCAPDRVGSGLIATYARPGSNITGTTRTTGISPGVNLLDLLHQLVPGLRRVKSTK